MAPGRLLGYTGPNRPGPEPVDALCHAHQINIIRTFVGHGAGTISPVVDMALSDRHRLDVTQTRRMGRDVTDTSLIISGDRRINGELRQALTVSNDGISFEDVLGGSTPYQARESNAALDAAYAALTRLVVE